MLVFKDSSFNNILEFINKYDIDESRFYRFYRNNNKDLSNKNSEEVAIELNKNKDVVITDTATNVVYNNISDCSKAVGINRKFVSAFIKQFGYFNSDELKTMHNKRQNTTYKGEPITINDFCEMTNLSRSIVYKKLRNGLSLDEIAKNTEKKLFFVTDIATNKTYTNLKQMCADLGIHPHTIYETIRNNGCFDSRIVQKPKKNRKRSVLSSITDIINNNYSKFNIFNLK